jgi:membrane-bound lytic murein transglycosylase D
LDHDFILAYVTASIANLSSAPKAQSAQRPAALCLWIATMAAVVLACGCAVPPQQNNSPNGETSGAALPASASPAPAPAPAPAEPAAAQAPAAPPDNTAPATPPEAADPLRPETRVDFDDPSTRIDLWSRLRAGYSMPTMDNTRVRKWEQYYSERPDYVARMTERGGRYLFYVVEELNKRNMPLDLALLPFVESAFNPQAMSVARAAGMWQFMPSTGRVYALKQNAFRDDRRDVLASTRAALDYLEKLGVMFNGDWQLALAAYNWGEGNVKRALQRKRDRNAPSVYESLRGMPPETRDYVPKLQAVKNIVARPEAFGLTLPPLENHPYFLSVAIDRDIDVELAAKLAEISLEEFQQLNPQMNRPVILAAGTPQILLTYEAANAFVRGLPRYEGALASWTVWVAPRTLKPSEAADLVGMSEAELRDVNRIPPSMLVQAGSSLVVPRPEQSMLDVPGHLAENGHLALTPDTRGFRRVTFRAPRRGDSVAAVAQRYHVPPEHVAAWNHVSVDASFRSGQNIVVMVTAKPVPSRRLAASTGKPANMAAKR